MSESRGVSFGMDFLGGDALSQLGGIVTEIGSIRSAAGLAEGDAQSLADSLSRAGDIGAESLADAGKEARTMGQAFRTEMSASLKAGDSMAKGVGAGIAGMAKTAIGKAKEIGTNLGNTAKGVAQAFLHPGQTIRSHLVKSLDESDEAAEELGREAKRTGDALGDMGSKGSGAGDSLAKSIKGIIAAVASAAVIASAATAIKDFVGASLNAAGAAEALSSRVEASFGTQADEVAAWAGNFAGAVHRSETEVKGFLTDSVGLYKSLGLTGEAAAELSKVTTSLGYDLGAAFNMSDAEAQKKLTDAIKGNAEAAATFGFALDEATLKQAALDMGIKSGIKDMDDATLAQVRMAAILGQTGDLQRSVAEDTGGMVNGMKGLTGIWDNFMAKAGAKFMPMVDQLFGVFFEAWPTLEPLLMGLVTILADGFADALPIFLELGKNLVPVLANTLGKLLGAVMPILPVIAELIGTLLPPLADIFGFLATTILPPLTDIFGVLITDVIQPLLPVIMQLISALLPPFVELLGMIAPVIQDLAPLLGTMAQLLLPIAGMLGDFIGTLLPPLMGILDTIFNSVLKPLLPVIMQLVETLLPPIASLLGLIAPLLGLIAPIIEAMAPIIEIWGQGLAIIVDVLGKIIGWMADGLGKVVGFFGSLFGGAKESKQEVDGLSSAVGNLADVTSEPPQLGIDTTAYTKDVTKASDTAASAIADSAAEAREVTDLNFIGMGLDAKKTYGDMTLDAETAWQRMTRAAEDGAAAIASAFGRIADAALGVSNASIQITGAGIPHHASGTDNFAGGPTFIHEQGDEVAVMPSGSKILTASQSDRLLRDMARGGGRSQAKMPDINIHIHGNVDTPTLEEMRRILAEEFRALMREVEDEDAMLDAVQYGFAR